MTSPIQVWANQSSQLIERLGKRFDSLNSERNSIDKEEFQRKIQNEWRKLNDIIYKEIPEKLKNPQDKIQIISSIRTQAKTVEGKFKAYFGEEKLQELRFKKKLNLFPEPVINSGIRGAKHEEPRLQQISAITEQQEKPKTRSIESTIYTKYASKPASKADEDLERSLRQSSQKRERNLLIKKQQVKNTRGIWITFITIVFIVLLAEYLLPMIYIPNIATQ